MADKLELLLEADRRGILPEDKKGLLGEARKRGLVPASLNNAPASAHVPQYANDASGQEIDLASPEYQESAKQQRAAYDSQNAAEQKRLANRGYGQRAVDAASFGLSIPVRIATGGKYGIGDAAGLLNENAGQNFRQSESDFAKANQGMLQGVADVGEASLGIPALSAMGAPARAVGRIAGKLVPGPLRQGEGMPNRYVQGPSAIKATIDTALASPRGTIAGAIRGTGETLERVGGKGLQGYADSIQPRTPKPTQAQPAMTGLPENIQTLPERLRDIQAFREEGIRPFGPATASQGVARGARTIEELPIIGGTVKSPKTDVELGFKNANEKLASDLGYRGNEEASGSMVQGALERYRTQGLEDLAPGTVKGTPIGPNGPQRPLGIDPYQPIKASESMSEAAAKRAKDPNIAAARAAGGGGTAETSRGATVTNARPLNQIGVRRTGVEDLSDADLARVARAPSQQTSFATRAEALYESADRKLPELKKVTGAANPNEIPTVNFGNTMKQTLREVGNQIAGQSTITGGLAKRIINGNANFTYADLKAVRTEIGRTLGNFGQFDVGLDRSQLKGLYSGATQDMEMGLRDIANRAWRDHMAGPTLPNGKPNLSYVEASVAKKADAALYEFRRADRYYRQGQARMDQFMQVLEAKTPNEAARKIVRALSERTANPQMIRQIMGVLRPEEQNALRGHIIASLGQGRAGSKAAETVMNFNHWATDYHKIMDNPAGKEFMTRGMSPELVKRLDNFARIANRMKYYEQTKNFSGSAYTGIIGAGAVAFTNPLAIPKLALATLGIAGMGKLLTSNGYMAWQEALMKAQLKAGNTAVSNARIVAQYAKRLPALAKMQRLDPDMQRSLTALGQAINQQLEGQETQKARALPPPSVPQRF